MMRAWLNMVTSEGKSDAALFYKKAAFRFYAPPGELDGASGSLNVEVVRE
jgi:hypothetical protein